MLAGVTLAMPLALACAGDPMTASNGRLRHQRDGYSVARPPDPPWTRISIKEAAVAYRAPGPAFMSLFSRCNRPVASPKIMARHLVIGLGERIERQAGPVQVGGLQGWSQIFDTQQDGSTTRVKTVTIVAGACTFDWLLSAKQGFEEAEPSFDAWWQSVVYEAPSASIARDGASG